MKALVMAFGAFGGMAARKKGGDWRVSVNIVGLVGRCSSGGERNEMDRQEQFYKPKLPTEIVRT
jgi:hypothetical protein